MSRRLKQMLTDSKQYEVKEEAPLAESAAKLKDIV